LSARYATRSPSAGGRKLKRGDLVGLKVKFSGQDAMENALKSKVDKARLQTPFAINEILARVANQQRTLLNLGSHPPGTPTGSAPGSPPWRISGHLRNSVRVRRALPKGADKWTGSVGPTAIYGRIQELGGRAGRGHSVYLPPRPSLKPAWALVRPTLSSKFRTAWR
jgi:phage gpG-like protein